MTMNRFFQKLRKKNKGQYRMLGFCIFLSVFLVTAFSLMYFGPTVQNFLPEGGDTRKMANLLITVTMAGCTIFTLYASNLFFRYKSREYGIFLALGEPKKDLITVLFKELSVLTVITAALGLIAAVPASWLIWKVFELFLVSTREMTYQFGGSGFFVGAVFACILALFLGIAGRRFVRKSDIIDILKTQQKTEMVKEISPLTLPIGIVLIVSGLFLGIGLPSISANVFHRQFPGITNLFYVLVLIGIYLVLLSIVAQSYTHLGRKERFYKNMVSISLMRFSAKSTTRNMCVIVLLLFACMFSAFYGMLYTDTDNFKNLENSKAFALHYPAEESQITREDIYQTAGKYSMDIKDFEEGDAANLVISHRERDLNDNGQYITLDNKKAKLALFFSVSTYQTLTGRSADVTSGTYKTLTITDYKENIWNFKDGLYEITNPDTDVSLNLTYGGILEYEALSSMSNPYAYVISDEDYKEMTNGLTDTYLEHTVLFNVADLDASYPFAKELIREYTERADKLSNHIGNYDMWEEKLAAERGESYGYSDSFNMTPDNAMLLDDWKYAPAFSIVTRQDFLQLICIYVMLCLYIFIITLTAVAIMTYVRSISVASDTKELFQNLTKLGADAVYQKNILKKQLAKIFQYPGILGCALSFLFALSICWFNDGRITDAEIHTLEILARISAFILIFLYGIYRTARKKSEKIIGIGAV